MNRTLHIRAMAFDLDSFWLTVSAITADDSGLAAGDPISVTPTLSIFPTGPALAVEALFASLDTQNHLIVACAFGHSRIYRICSAE